MTHTVLTFRNESWDLHLSEVALCHPTPAGPPLAWAVIRQCWPGWRHVLPVADSFTLRVTDPDGNCGPAQPVSTGGEWSARVEPGCSIRLCHMEPRPDDTVHVRNAGSRAPLRVDVLRDGRPAWRSPWLRAGQRWSVTLRQDLLAVAGRRFQEEAPIHPGELYTPPTPLPLTGLTRPQLLLLGGGRGPQAGPLRFVLLPHP
ncbi:MAG: hypothetical protein H6739_18580 [Alphaproteobacteria bacterium]|nr:hypothetical protein [Alphaproteobacteria bacterium]